MVRYDDIEHEHIRRKIAVRVRVRVTVRVSWIYWLGCVCVYNVVENMQCKTIKTDYYYYYDYIIIIIKNNCGHSIMSPSERRIVGADLSRDQDVQLLSCQKEAYSNEQIRND